MKKDLSSAQWLRRFLALVLAVLALLAVLVYMIDPYYHYRAYDHKYKLDKVFSVPGIVKNFDYDAIIIGSSMTQNFDMDSFRRELGQNPIKATLGGMDWPEMAALLKLAQDAGHAETYYLCIDSSLLTGDASEQHFPEYLLDDNFFNDYRYFWGYEVWTRFIPLDLALLAADKLGINLPQRFQDARSIDKMGEWAPYYTFGKERTLEVYSAVFTGGIPGVDISAQEEVSMAQCRQFLDSLDLSQGNIVLFFPPYSSLFWYEMEQSDSLEIYFEVKRYFIQQASAYENVSIFDFQGADFTADLDNYKDLTHFSPRINDELVRCFASGEYRLTPEQAGETELQIRQNIETLLAENPEIPGLRG